MKINEDLADEIKGRVFYGIEKAHEALLNDPAIDYDKLSNTLLQEIDDYFSVSVTMPDIYGELEVPKNVRKKKQHADRVCKIHYPITAHVHSLAVLALIRSSAPPEIVFDVDRITVIQHLGARDIDEADFKSAVFSVRRFLNTIDAIANDVQAIVADAKAKLKQEIAALFVERRDLSQ